MSERATVHVSGITAQTSDKEVEDFFSFCGKITSISVTPTSNEPDAPKSAAVTFEKEAAAKTALLLDSTQLGSSTVHVTSAHNLDELADTSTTVNAEKDENGHDVPQEDKPRSRIFAEYLAHGYVIGDSTISKAIALDKKHGFSNRFTTALSNFDNKYKATDRARGLDDSYKLSDKAATGWRGLHSYFEKALGTPSGQKLRDFYVSADKQVRDIHAEARRLADLKSGKTASASASGEAEAQAQAQAQAPAAGGEAAPASAPQSAGGAAPEKA